MGPQDDGPLEARPPTREDLLDLCRELNARNVDYMVVGGMAIIQHGYLRATEDIDLLVRTTLENERNVIDALLCLPDKAAAELEPGDIEKYNVIRVADEFVVDLMHQACGIDFQEAAPFIKKVTIDEVEIPFASLELLWRMKQTVREKDKLDLLFIREQLKKNQR
ncbi:MAG: hypothetical protein Q7P63_14245 [Verrucomicrobiota bacterium JB022]|nr:hypothetical protein [Verrucomicrobiota bacterium JB022]